MVCEMRDVMIIAVMTAVRTMTDAVGVGMQRGRLRRSTRGVAVGARVTLRVRTVRRLHDAAVASVRSAPNARSVSSAAMTSKVMRGGSVRRDGAALVSAAAAIVAPRNRRTRARSARRCARRRADVIAASRARVETTGGSVRSNARVRRKVRRIARSRAAIEAANAAAAAAAAATSADAPTPNEATYVRCEWQ